MKLPLLFCLLFLTTVVRSEINNADPWDRNNLPQKIYTKFTSAHVHYRSFRNVESRPDGIRGVSTGGSDGLTPLPRDLLFVIDMSGSIHSREWATMKRKLADLIERLCGTIGSTPQHNRIAIITFSSRVVLNFNFKTHWTMPSVRRAILSMPQERGITCTGDALRYAHSFMFDPSTGVRSATESIKEAFIIVDGLSNCGANVAQHARRLQTKAFVYAMAIGNFSNRGKREIESIVSRPLIDHIFSLANFVEFKRMVDIMLTYPEKCVPFELSK